MAELWKMADWIWMLFGVELSWLRNGCIRWDPLSPRGRGCFGVFSPIGLNGNFESILEKEMYSTCA